MGLAPPEPIRHLGFQRPTTITERLRTALDERYVLAGAEISMSGDGERFVMLHQADESRIVVVTNWLTELRARLGSRRP